MVKEKFSFNSSEFRTSPEINPDYNHSIDFLRGLAALFVCFRHLTVGNDDYLSPANSLKQISAFGWVGVQIFFIISGFVIPYSMYRYNYSVKDFGRFFLKRVIRIEPPYVISLFLIILLAFLGTLVPMYRGPGFHIDLEGFFVHFVYLNAICNYDWLNPVFWTLSIEFQFYILIALLFPFIMSDSKYIRYFTLILMVGLGFFITDQYYFFYHSSLFAIGIIIFYYKISGIDISQMLFALGVLLVCVFIRMDAPHLYASIFTISLLTFLNINWNSSNFLGKISFSLYLIHIPIGLRVINLSERFVVNEIGRVVVIFFAVVISIVFASVFFRFIELPFQIYSKKINYGK